MSDMKITAVAPWYGSNRMLASKVAALMGKQKWIGVPFAGGMSELLHLQARTIVVNDLHRHVINLARVMADWELGPQLYRRLRRQILHPDTLTGAQTRCETVHPPFGDAGSPMGRGLFHLTEVFARIAARHAEKKIREAKCQPLRGSHQDESLAKG